jgi:Methyltransferase domain
MSRSLDSLEKVRCALQEQRFVASTLRRTMPRVIRSVSRPLIGEFSEFGGIHTSASSALRATLGNRYDRVVQDTHETEYIALAEELKRRYESLRVRGATIPPESYAIEDDTGLLMYSLLRSLRPRVVLETGVANGHSTFLALRALVANGAGSLYSTDIESKSGELLDADDKRPWNFRLLRKAHVRADFEAVLSELATVDFFFHDSEHTYAWQMREYQAAWGKRSRASTLFSDDIEESYAFLDFCHQRRTPPIVLFDKRKVVGVVPLPATGGEPS